MSRCLASAECAPLVSGLGTDSGASTPRSPMVCIRDAASVRGASIDGRIGDAMKPTAEGGHNDNELHRLACEASYG